MTAHYLADAEVLNHCLFDALPSAASDVDAVLTSDEAIDTYGVDTIWN